MPPNHHLLQRPSALYRSSLFLSMAVGSPRLSKSTRRPLRENESRRLRLRSDKILIQPYIVTILATRQRYMASRTGRNVQDELVHRQTGGRVIYLGLT
jgi:hypothetical protein